METVEVVELKRQMQDDFATTDKMSDEEHRPTLFLRDYQFWNVLGVSLAFMVLFSAFHTCGMLQVSRNIKKKYRSSNPQLKKRCPNCYNKPIN
jgi:hypothetical protein